MPIKTVMRWLLGGAFALAGVNHFLRPDVYARIVPPYLPWHPELVAVSGGVEIALGVLVLVPRYTRPAAWGLVTLLIAVFPANVHMATHVDEFPAFNPVVLWARLPFQGVLVAWAYWFTRGAGEGRDSPAR